MVPDSILQSILYNVNLCITYMSLQDVFGGKCGAASVACLVRVCCTWILSICPAALLIKRWTYSKNSEFLSQ
jgi:hypothetical protein